jgi:hypothetical protein
MVVSLGVVVVLHELALPATGRAMLEDNASATSFAIFVSGTAGTSGSGDARLIETTVGLSAVSADVADGIVGVTERETMGTDWVPSWSPVVMMAVKPTSGTIAMGEGVDWDREGAGRGMGGTRLLDDERGGVDEFPFAIMTRLSVLYSLRLDVELVSQRLVARRVELGLTDVGSRASREHSTTRLACPSTSSSAHPDS